MNNVQSRDQFSAQYPLDSRAFQEEAGDKKGEVRYLFIGYPLSNGKGTKGAESRSSESYGYIAHFKREAEEEKATTQLKNLSGFCTRGGSGEPEDESSYKKLLLRPVSCTPQKSEDTGL
jgi:hypothetical protein